MRGKAKCQLDNVRCGRITPAYAGKSFAGWSGTLATGDHPRVCGEKSESFAITGVTLGSPPRMRGKAPSLAVFGACIGITPAYAGKSGLLITGRGFFWDHPRVCGEKQKLNRMPTSVIGSPPRMRGKERFLLA